MSDKKSTISVSNKVKTRDVARNLKKPESTIRKYGQDLEKHGYSFTKDANGTRYFSSEDEAAMLEYIRFREETGMSVDLAANAVVRRRQEPIDELSPSNTKGFTEIKAIDMQQVIQQLSALSEQLPTKQQVSYITETVEKIVNQNTELSKIIQDKEKTNEDLNQKLNKSVDIINSFEEKLEKIEEKLDKKKKLFGIFG